MFIRKSRTNFDNCDARGVIISRTCANCEAVDAPPSRCVPSRRVNVDSNLSVHSAVLQWVSWLGEFLTDDFRAYLYQCDACDGYFCNDCAGEVLGELRFCPSCAGTSAAMSIVLEDAKLRREPMVWWHVGTMLNAGESVDFRNTSTTYTDAKDAPTQTITSFSKIQCLAKALELQPTKQLWSESRWSTLAASMEWSDTVTIAVTSNNADLTRKSTTTNSSRNRSMTSAGSVTTPRISRKKDETFTLTTSEVFTIAIHLNPSDATTWCNLGIVMPANMKLQLGSHEYGKLECFQESLRLDPENVTAGISRAICLFDKQRANSRDACSTSSLNSPCERGSPSMKSTASSQLHDESRPLMQSVVPLDSNASANSNSMLNQNDPIRCLLSALTLKPHSGKAWSALALMLDSPVADVPHKVLDALHNRCGKTTSSSQHSTTITKIDALRMAATLCFTEETIFELAMGLSCAKEADQRSLSLKHKIFDSQKPNKNLEYTLDRTTVLEALAELHISPRYRRRFPLSSAKVSFAVTCACPNSPNVREINARYLIADALHELGKTDKIELKQLKTDAQLQMWDTIHEFPINLSAPFDVRDIDGTLHKDKSQIYKRRIHIRCRADGAPNMAVNDIMREIEIGNGTQGVVLKALYKHPATQQLSSLAVKLYLHIPAVDVLDSTKDSTNSRRITQTDNIFDDLVREGDLKFMLSSKISGVTVTTRHAVAINLEDEESFRHEDLSLRGGGFVSQCMPGGEYFFTDEKGKRQVKPNPYLVMIFMDRGLFSLRSRCDGSAYQPLPRDIAARVLGEPEDSPELREGGQFYLHAFAAAQQVAPHFMLEREASYYCRSIVKHLQKLHANDVVHGDIKPDNVLLMPNGEVRLADFGVSYRYHHSDLRTTAAGETSVGTYIPPGEETASKYPSAVDIWALGQSLRFMLSWIQPDGEDPKAPPSMEGSRPERCSSRMGEGKSPLLKMNTSMARLVRHDLIDKTSQIIVQRKSTMSAHCRAFLERCLCQQASDRATCEELLKMKFLNDEVDDEFQSVLLVATPDVR